MWALAAAPLPLCLAKWGEPAAGLLQLVAGLLLLASLWLVARRRAKEQPVTDWCALCSAGGEDVAGCGHSAQECLQKALEANPRCAEAWHKLGLAGGGQVAGKGYSHKDCHRRALELAPRMAEAWSGLGLIGGGQVGGRMYTESECYRKAAGLDPRLAWVEQLAAKYRAAKAQPPTSAGVACCLVCFEHHNVGLSCGHGHFLCEWDATRHVAAHLRRVGEDQTMLEQHRLRGGCLKCLDASCQEVYEDVALARLLPPRVFAKYRQAQLEATEHRLWKQFEAQSQQREEANVIEFLCREFPNARMCPDCSYGPVINEDCDDLASHHGQEVDTGTISNACPRCGFFSAAWGEWASWDGTVHADS